ncbi:unnamed protein product [Caenorhabditis sp. 36 PRJEB53466]|nr:unnamed protein product [Caenorhabditis sp. 36 PRJEB53466]
MGLPPVFLLIFWASSIANSLPLAPPPPDFNADFSKRAAKSDLMAVVDEDELQSLRHNGFQEQLRRLREKNIGRDPMTVTEEMARIGNSIEDISEFSLDSAEIDEAINDITIPTTSQLKKSSKFSELSEIHNTDSSNKSLPPFAFSEDEEEIPESIEKVEIVPPSTPVAITLPTTTQPTTTTTIWTSTSTTPPPKHNIMSIDSDVEVPGRESSPSPVVDSAVTTFVPTAAVTTTIPTTATVIYSPPTTTHSYFTSKTQSPHIFSSTTVRLPSPIFLASSSAASSVFLTTPRPFRGPFTTEFKIEPVKKRSEGGAAELRERIRSTSQLLNLLGDRIEGIDQQMTMNQAVPKTGVLPNIYDRGEVKRRNYRNKQWGKTGIGRQGVQTYDGQFSGVAYGATKQRGGGYTMRKKMAKRPWTGRGYKTRRLGERRPDGMSPTTFLEKKTTEVSVEPYGSKRRGEWIRGVKQSERRNAVRRVSEKQKSLAEALLESEESSMRQLKKTLRQIRDVVRFKTSSTTATMQTTTSTVKPAINNRLHESFYKGTFDLKR